MKDRTIEELIHGAKEGRYLDFKVDGQEALRINGRLRVPDVDALRQEVL